LRISSTSSRRVRENGGEWDWPHEEEQPRPAPVVLGALGYFAWSQYARAARLKTRAASTHPHRFRPIQRQAQLKSARSRTGDGTRHRQGFRGRSPSETIAVLPFAVDYHIDVSRLVAQLLPLGQANQDADHRRARCYAGKPNIDETKARVQQKRIHLPPRLARSGRQVSQAPREVDAGGAKPEYLNKARENARAVIMENGARAPGRGRDRGMSGLR
jgi:hypothetical protein